MKNADVSSLFKKDDNMSKRNYRPISLLPINAKIFERLMHKKLSEFTARFFTTIRRIQTKVQHIACLVELFAIL